jgi:hypothetical protein
MTTEEKKSENKFDNSHSRFVEWLSYDFDDNLFHSTWVRYDGNEKELDEIHKWSKLDREQNNLNWTNRYEINYVEESGKSFEEISKELGSNRIYHIIPGKMKLPENWKKLPVSNFHRNNMRQFFS